MDRRSWLILAAGVALASGCDSDPTGVPADEVATVEVSPATRSLAVGDTVRLTATAKTAGGRVVTGPTVGWATGDAARASVTPSGSTALVRALAEGPVSVTATVSGRTGTANVQVQPEPVFLVEVSPSTVVLRPGDTLRVAAIAYGAGGAVLTGRTVAWAGGDASKALVTADGDRALIEAVGQGWTTVTATVGGVSADATVLVEAQAAGSIEVEPGSATIQVGQAVALQAVVRDMEGNVMPGASPLWLVDEESVGTLTYMAEPGRVVFNGRGEGVALITAWLDQASTTVAVRVEEAPPTASGIELHPSTLTVEAGKVVELRATVWGPDGAPVANPSVTWSTSDATVATVSGRTGGRAELAARTGGPVNVFATSGGKTAVANVTVVSRPAVAAVHITQGPRALWQGSGALYRATVWGTGGSGPLPSAPVTWSVEDPSVLDIDAVGQVLARKAGSTRVWAESGGVRGSMSVAVKAWPMDGVVTMDMVVGVDPWGTPRLLNPVGTTTWTDGQGTTHPAELLLAGGRIDFLGEGRYTRTVYTDVAIRAGDGSRTIVDRRTATTGGQIGYDWFDSYTFHLIPDGGGPRLTLDAFEAGAWIGLEAFGAIPALPWRWDMR